MRNLSQAHIIAINQLLLKTTATYIGGWRYESDCADSLKMYAEDVKLNVTALVAFNQDRDVLKLHDSIMRQDTLVRETYFNVLQYIEAHNLIPRRYFSVM